MFVIKGIFDDSWCDTAEDYKGVFAALKPLVFSDIAAQLNDYRSKSSNTVCVNALNEVIGKQLDAFKTFKELSSQGAQDTVNGVSATDVYLVVKHGHSMNGTDIDTIRNGVAGLQDKSLLSTVHHSHVYSDEVQACIAEMLLYINPKYHKVADTCIHANKCILQSKSDDNLIRSLKRVISYSDWLQKAFTYMESVGIGAGETEEGWRFNFESM